MGWLLFLFPFVALVRTRDRRIHFLAALFFTQCAYSVYVGGDAWEWWGGSNRYIAIVMPLFFLLLAFAFARLKSAWERVTAWRSSAGRRATRLGFSLLLLLAYFQGNQGSGIAGFSAGVDGGSFLASYALGRQAGVGSSEVCNVMRWLVVPAPLEALENVRRVRAAILLDSISAPGARVAVTEAGAVAYFSERTFVDLLGKNDRTVARVEGRAAIDPAGKLMFTPGHAKWDYNYSIGVLKPDVVFQLWLAQDEARPVLDRDYRAVTLLERPRYFRRDSGLIRWDVLAREAQAGVPPDGGSTGR